jgi:hypothetical protein
MEPRFELDANDAATTLAYFRNRAVQLLHDDEDWRWSGLVTPLVHQGLEWGSETIFRDRDERPFVSVYVYAHARGRGHLRRHAGLRPRNTSYLTSPGCNVFDALAHLDPSTRLAAPMCAWPEYHAIEQHYGDGRARRSGVYFMHHIDEGLRVLHRWLHASDRAKRAWCLHPLVQGDADLRRSYDAGLLHGFEPEVVALALEYRSFANAFLSPMESHPGYGDPSKIAQSPLPEVGAMLTADKLQNCKDFRLHHRGPLRREGPGLWAEAKHKEPHPRTSHLERYFDSWLAALGVDPGEVDRLARETLIPACSLAPAREL